MTITNAQFGAALDALREVLAFRHPADAVLTHHFRGHRELGQRDRAFVAESVFGVLRRKLLLDRLVGKPSARATLLLWLARFGGRSTRELAPLLKPGEAEWLAEKKAAATDDLPLALRADLPDWVVERLQKQWPDEEILALGRALQQPAPLDLRVNTLKADRDTVLARLAAEGLKAEPTRLSPIGVRVHGRPALHQHPLYLDGSIEVQDEGSQLLGYLLAPRRHQLAVDFCAGAGGKTLMLGVMMHSQGRLYALDVSAARLARFKPRLARSGLSNVHPHAIRDEHDTKVKRLGGKIDRVLVDAPCSGLGTLRRNPDLKWRQSAAALAELAAKQSAILQSAATLVKPGGRLVYATCSLLVEENQDVVARFLSARDDFDLLPAGTALAEQRIALDTGLYLELKPHVHGTDGFFAAVLQRKLR